MHYIVLDPKRFYCSCAVRPFKHFLVGSLHHTILYSTPPIFSNMFRDLYFDMFWDYLAGYQGPRVQMNMQGSKCMIKVIFVRALTSNGEQPLHATACTCVQNDIHGLRAGAFSEKT